MPIKTSINDSITTHKNKSPPKIDYGFSSIIEITYERSFWDVDESFIIRYDIPGCIYRIVKHHKKISITEIENILKSHERKFRHGDIIRSLNSLPDVERSKENLVWIVGEA